MAMLNSAKATPIPKLPTLRQELTLTPGSLNDQGAPTWVLQDPVRNRFFQLDWAAFEMLSRWDLQEADAIVAEVNQATTLQIGLEDVQALVQFLTHQHLLQAYSPEHTARLTQAAKASKASGLRWLLHHYLFFRIPLVRPTAFLDWCAPAFNRVFTPGFWWAVLGLLALGIYWASRQWDAFIHTFAAYSGWQGLLSIGLALCFAKVLHELGHALTAHHYGCRVPTMGVAFLVMMPLLYTDTTDAWKLGQRRQRMHIAAAGILAELVLAVVALVLWSFLPDGPLRAGVFLLATSTWVITLAINASPFMRFDGYFLLADHLNLPNLHERAFALGRWWLREWLFGLNDPIPEQFPPQRRRLLIAFAFGTAIYRAVLFFSIALLVYNLFFKVLGIVLMLVELLWFIAFPVQREIKVWLERFNEAKRGRNTPRSVALLLILLALVAIPWKTSLQVPAVISAAQAQGIYASSAALVQQDAPPQGTPVKAGQVLLQLDSPDLTYKLHLAQTKEQQLRWQLDQQPLTSNQQMANAPLRKRWEAAAAAVSGLQERQQQLTITAPFDGVIVERNPSLTPGTWIASGEKLFHIINPTSIKGEAYLNENQLLQMRNLMSSSTAAGQTGFIANQSQFPKLHCSLEQIDKLNLAQLDHLYVASSYGGSIASQTNKDGKTTPLQATFRVRLGQCLGENSPLQQELAGIANLQGESRSLLGRALRSGLALVHSEAGF